MNPLQDEMFDLEIQVSPTIIVLEAVFIRLDGVEGRKPIPNHKKAEGNINPPCLEFCSALKCYKSSFLSGCDVLQKVEA